MVVFFFFSLRPSQSKDTLTYGSGEKRQERTFCQWTCVLLPLQYRNNFIRGWAGSSHEPEALFKWTFRKKFVCRPVKSSISHTGVGGKVQAPENQHCIIIIAERLSWLHLKSQFSDISYDIKLQLSRNIFCKGLCCYRFLYSEIQILWSWCLEKKLSFMMKTRICACWICKSALWNCECKQSSGVCDPQVWLLATAQGNAHSSGIFPGGPWSFPDLGVKELILAIKHSKKSKCTTQGMDQSSDPANPPVGWQTSDRQFYFKHFVCI